MFRFFVLTMLWMASCTAWGQVPVMETGGGPMPDEWIDKDTGHKVMKLTRRKGRNSSFYFHNNPFIGNEMVFKGGDVPFAGNDNFHGAGIRRRTKCTWRE